MRNNRGVTLITVIITVILLAMIAGIAINSGMETYYNSKVVKFETYMKVIQKEVDLILEEGTDYMSLGSALTDVQKTELETIITNNSAYIETYDVEEEKLRYFSSSDIEELFGISDVNDRIVINFANREVISLNGVEKDGVVHYVEYGLH